MGKLATCVRVCILLLFFFQSLKPDIKIIAAEPKNADDCARSFAAGTLIPNASPPQTIADALRYSVMLV